MSKVNFMKVEYRLEAPRQDAVCGILDGENEQPAYTTVDSSLKWDATITNPKTRTFQFVPVDKNIVWFRENGVDRESSCDGMILVEQNEMIIFVELKDVISGGSFSKAIDQLKTTIVCFLENHRYSDYKVRRAYASNRHHPYFHYSKTDEIEEFRNQLHFALYPEATIRL